MQSSHQSPNDVQRLDQIAAAAARQSLLSFCCWTLPTPYCPAPHLLKLIDYLERLERGEIKRLMVFMPPRHGKSVTISQLFPCWYLGRHPHAQIVQCGYGTDITIFHSRKARDILASARFHKVFPHVVHQPERAGQDSIEIQKQAAHEWGTRMGGRYYAVGVGGGLTGRGCELAILDDVVKNREEANSEAVRTRILEWYRSTLYTRLTPNGAIILVMTRWHPNDLAGSLLEEMSGGGEQWEVLKLPAIDSDGGALWPELWSTDKLQAIKEAIGSVEFSALYQQEPQDPESCIFRREWFVNFVDAPPPYIQWIRSWDLAVTESTSADFTAGAKVGVTSEGAIIVDGLVHGKWEMPEAVKIIAATAKQDGNSVVQGVEYVGTQKAFLQTLLRDPTLVAHTFVPIEVTRDKVIRARPVQARCEVGKFIMVRGDWNQKLIDEFCSFSPVCKHDDIVDAVSGAIQHLGVGMEFAYKPVITERAASRAVVRHDSRRRVLM